MYVQYMLLESVPATIPISGLPLICSDYTNVLKKELPIYSSKTVVFLESGNDITTKQQYMTMPLHVTNADLDDADLGSIELNSAEDKMLHQNECRNMRRKTVVLVSRVDKS
jgi:hypothetical protein